MAKTKEQKIQTLNQLKDYIKQSKMIVWLKILGLSVNEQNQLKSELKKAEAKAMVAKKTLASLAFEKLGLEKPDLENIHNSILFSFAFDDDFIPALKVIYKFSKDFEEGIEILGGYDKERMYSLAEIKALAKLPSKEVLLGNLVGSINAPIFNFVYALKNNLSKLIWALEAIKAKKVA